MSMIHDAYVALNAGLTTYHPDHQNEIVWSTHNGEEITVELVDKSGAYIVRKYFKNGILSCVERRNCDDVLFGKCTTYNRIGNIVMEVNYKNNMANGRVCVYYDSGEPRFERWYKNNVPDGVWKLYSKDGSVTKQCEFKNGRKV